MPNQISAHPLKSIEKLFCFLYPSPVFVSFILWVVHLFLLVCILCLLCLFNVPLSSFPLPVKHIVSATFCFERCYMNMVCLLVMWLCCVYTHVSEAENFPRKADSHKLRAIQNQAPLTCLLSFEPSFLKLICKQVCLLIQTMFLEPNEWKTGSSLTKYGAMCILAQFL